MSRPEPARITVERVAGRIRVRDLRASWYLRPQLLGGSADHSRIALVAACASLLAGDDLQLVIEVGPGASLELVEPSGTVAYHARGGRACWTASVRLAADARLVWNGAPFVIAHGANVRRHTGIDMDTGAAMLLREMLVLGRSDENGGALRSTLRADLDGRPLQVEDLDLTEPALRSLPGVLGTARVLATATLLGVRPGEPVTTRETPLHGPGALRREIAYHAHVAASALAPTWTRWRDLVAGCPGSP